MTAEQPTRDVLAVTVGAGGVRARRTGRSDAPDTFVEVPDAPVEADAARLPDLVATVAALTDRGGAQPEAIVWAVPRGWDGGPAADLLAVLAGRAARVAVVGEAVASYVGAFGGVRPGVCLSVGVDAQALAGDGVGAWRSLDGWGPLLGSRGSGAWLGAHGLAAGLRARDGLPDGSAALLAAGRVAFGPEATWRDLIEGADAATALATFAPAVCDAAHDDPLARAIVEAGADHLADLLEAGRRDLPGAPIVAVGGLLYVEGVRVALAAALARRRLFLVPGLGGALEGARLVGEHLLAGGALAHRPPYVLLADRGELPPAR